MGTYHKYGIDCPIRLTQVDETINQLETIKFPTQLIQRLKKSLKWIQQDFEPTIKILNQQAKEQHKELHNTKNIQLNITFSDL